MKFHTTPIDGLIVVEPLRHGDDRGYFMETFVQCRFNDAIGREVRFVQDNESLSRRGVLRGLHLQRGEASQAKLVRVSEGAVWDVAVDLRKDSQTFGQWYGLELSSDNALQLFIPRGFAHGFVVLSERARFEYKVDNLYAPESELTIRYDDPTIAVEWPATECGHILSSKDAAALTLAEVRDLL